MKQSSKVLCLGGISIAALGFAASGIIMPRLAWNASSSAPIGLYFVRSGALEIGDFVLVSPDAGLESFIEWRGYLPPRIPLLKRVAATAGNEVCRRGNRVFIDEFLVADALVFDSERRPLPVWEGCLILSRDEIFLLNDHQRSLDGRYFGATDLNSVIGKAQPIWIRRDAASDPLNMEKR